MAAVAVLALAAAACSSDETTTAQGADGTASDRTTATPADESADTEDEDEDEDEPVEARNVTTIVENEPTTSTTSPAEEAEDEEAEDDEDGGAASTTSTTAGTTTTADPAPASGELSPTEPGQSGDAVLALQNRLAEIGFAPGTPDGSYGRRTTAAVSAFQTLVGIEATGIADAGTIASLSGYTYDGVVLHAGDEGQAVAELQQRLTDGPFDPGPVDGQYGTATVQAVWALEKLAGVPVDGDWGPLDELAWQQLQAGQVGAPTQSHDLRWVEVDLSQQLLKVYDPGSTTPVLVSHVSTGSGQAWSNDNHSGSSITPTGSYEISRRIAGWRESSLDIGRLYNPLYFNGGIAFHGALSVPLYPASHGCVRVPMHIAEYLPGELANGTPVLVEA